MAAPKSTFDPTKGLKGATSVPGQSGGTSIFETLGNLAAELNPLGPPNEPKEHNKLKPTCASIYGGPTDPSSGHIGYKQDDLRGKMAFAELGMGTALGKLPYKTKILIEYKGKSVVAEKLDIGAGGPGCGGHARTIDLWWETARALGFKGGLDVVKYETTEQALTREKHEEEQHEPFADLARAFAPLKDIGEFFHFIGSTEGWARIGKVVLGGILILVAFDQLAKVGSGSNAPSVAKKATEVGAAVGVGKALKQRPQPEATTIEPPDVLSKAEVAQFNAELGEL